MGCAHSLCCLSSGVSYLRANEYSSSPLVPALYPARVVMRVVNQIDLIVPTTRQSFYGRSRRRLLVFDYDGTLVAHHALAQLSAPPPVLLQVLEALCEVMRFTCNTSSSILKVDSDIFVDCTDI